MMLQEISEIWRTTSVQWFESNSCNDLKVKCNVSWIMPKTLLSGSTLQWGAGRGLLCPTRHMWSLIERKETLDVWTLAFSVQRYGCHTLAYAVNAFSGSVFISLPARHTALYSSVTSGHANLYSESTGDELHRAAAAATTTELMLQHREYRPDKHAILTATSRAGTHEYEYIQLDSW